MISGEVLIKAAANFVVTLFLLDSAHPGNVIEGGLPLEPVKNKQSTDRL
jgi:hypothetical protein